MATATAASSLPTLVPSMIAALRPCAQFARALPAYLAGELSCEFLLRWRSHRNGCSYCARSFSSLVERSSQLAAPLAARARSGERAARRARNRGLALAGALAGSSFDRGRVSWQRLKPLLMCAVLLCSFQRHSQGTRPQAWLECKRGSAWVDGKPLPSGQRSNVLPRGSELRLFQQASATLCWPSARAELGGDSQASIEDPRRPRLRLERGRVVWHGPGTVTTPGGMVEVSAGACAVEWDGQRLLARAIEPRTRARRLDAQGARVLAGWPSDPAVR